MKFNEETGWDYSKLIVQGVIKGKLSGQIELNAWE